MMMLFLFIFSFNFPFIFFFFFLLILRDIQLQPECIISTQIIIEHPSCLEESQCLVKFQCSYVNALSLEDNFSSSCFFDSLIKLIKQFFANFYPSVLFGDNKHCDVRLVWIDCVIAADDAAHNILVVVCHDGQIRPSSEKVCISEEGIRLSQLLSHYVRDPVQLFLIRKGHQFNLGTDGLIHQIQYLYTYDISVLNSNLFQMVENIYKTFNQKAQCAHTLKNKNIIHNFKAKTSFYEIKALTLIEHQLYIHNTLLFLQKLNNFQDRRIRQVFNKLNQNIEAQTHKKKGKRDEKNQRLKGWLLELKIKKVIENIQHKKKLESFKFMKQCCFCRNAFPACQLYKKTKITNKISNDENVCRMDENKNMLSNLDISEIQVNNGREIILSTSCNQIGSMDLNYKSDKQMGYVKHQIKQKEQYLQLLYKQFQRISSPKSNKITEKSIVSQLDVSNIEKENRKEKAKEGDQCQLIGILIKKNFQLEEKLDEVYQLLGAIQPDKGTQFGKILQKLRRKKCFHISFQNQKSSL